MSCSVEGKDVMPVLPDDFKASIQTTYVEQDNRVVTMTQYHDYTNNRVRLEREGTDDKKLVDMFFFDELTHYSIETGDEIICALDTIDPLIGSGQPKIDDSGHILHTANMWKESSNYNYNFKGDSEIKFNGKRTMMEKYEGQTQIGSSKYKLSWYWSIKERKDIDI